MFEWRVYKGAIIPGAPPHTEPGPEDVLRAKKLGKYRFISYTTDFDCPEETAWWYVLKDAPLHLEDIPSQNMRYKIRKGLKYVEVRKIDGKDYGEALYDCYLKAQKRYKAYGGSASKEIFMERLQTDPADYYAAFFRETGQLVAYMRNDVYDDYVDMTVIKYDPDFLKYQISAALTYQVVHDYMEDGRYKYVLDGQRAIRHKTNIQEYLEHNFGFRKAYCRLNIVYSPSMKLLVSIAYPFRKLLERLAGERVFFNNVLSVLNMEQIRRECK